MEQQDCRTQCRTGSCLDSRRRDILKATIIACISVIMLVNYWIVSILHYWRSSNYAIWPYIITVAYIIFEVVVVVLVVWNPIPSSYNRMRGLLFIVFIGFISHPVTLWYYYISNYQPEGDYVRKSVWAGFVLHSFFQVTMGFILVAFTYESIWKRRIVVATSFKRKLVSLAFLFSSLFWRSLISDTFTLYATFLDLSSIYYPGFFWSLFDLIPYLLITVSAWKPATQRRWGIASLSISIASIISFIIYWSWLIPVLKHPETLEDYEGSDLQSILQTRPYEDFIILPLFPFAQQIFALIFSISEIRRAMQVQVTEDVTFNDLTLLNGISIGKKLGSGSFGDVYLGLWRSNVKVAVKKLANTNQTIAFLKEASVLQTLNHPNVIRFFGIYVTDANEKYIVMEFASQGSLLDLVKSPQIKLSYEDTIEMAKHMCAGLSYLESMNVCHRDVALRNMLVDKVNDKYIVKVADLGLGRKMGTAEEMYVPAQKEKERVPLRWVAPEVFSSKSDVWSYGVTLLELFTGGERPYVGLEDREVTKLVTSGGYPKKPPSCPDELYEIVRNCFQYNPNLRPSFAEIQEMLDKIVAPPKIVASKETLASQQIPDDYQKTPSTEKEVYDTI